MSTQAGFKGRGFAFPPAFARGGAAVAMVEGDEDIAQSLRIILATRPGERVMQPSFGCDLDAFVFEEIDQGLISRLTRIVSDAILFHEPRVDLLGVEVTQSDTTAGLLTIEIRYRSRLTNSRWNMVYPYYLREAVPDPGVGGG
jgi:phage baseplate assembly protein W